MVTNSAGVAVLGKGLGGREFPEGKHPLLCKRKLSYVIMGPGCPVHEMNGWLSGQNLNSPQEEHRVNRVSLLFSEPRGVCTKIM